MMELNRFVEKQLNNLRLETINKYERWQFAQGHPGPLPEQIERAEQRYMAQLTDLDKLLEAQGLVRGEDLSAENWYHEAPEAGVTQLYEQVVTSNTVIEMPDAPQSEHFRVLVNDGQSSSAEVTDIHADVSLDDLIQEVKNQRKSLLAAPGEVNAERFELLGKVEDKLREAGVELEWAAEPVSEGRTIMETAADIYHGIQPDALHRSDDGMSL